jgi:uncharacterized membrane protein (UPF0127 family)
LLIVKSPPANSNLKDNSNNSIVLNNHAVLKTGSLKVNGQKINIEIAENDQQWYQGLSDRDSLGADSGMYFIFPAKNKLDFVMRNMRFPLDIIFINDDKILNIAENLAPEGSETKNIYSSVGEANRVLEVNAGYCKKYGIKAGDLISDLQIN